MGTPIIAMCDSKSKLRAADMVPKKGEDPFAIKGVSQIIQSLGHKKILRKSGKAYDICALERAVRREWRNPKCESTKAIDESKIPSNKSKGYFVQ